MLARARAAGVTRCLCVGTTLEDSRAVVAIARQYPGMVAATVGVHPHETAAVTEAMLSEVDRLAGEPGVVAIGEVGLDFYREHAPREAQERALRRFVAMAQRRHLPLALHCREAYEPLIRLLREEATGPLRGVIHCASGPAEFIQGALALGLSVSFAGNVTFPSAGSLRQLVGLVPDERLLIETDAPFLAPQPVRGQPNEPAYVVHTATLLAQLRGTSLEGIVEHTSRNAQRLFGLPG